MASRSLKDSRSVRRKKTEQRRETRGKESTTKPRPTLGEPSSSRPIRPVGVMALSHLASRACVPALLRASAPRFPTAAAGARRLSYRSSQVSSPPRFFPLDRSIVRLSPQLVITVGRSPTWQPQIILCINENKCFTDARL